MFCYEYELTVVGRANLDSPEKVSVLLDVGVDDATVGEDDLVVDNIVTSETLADREEGDTTLNKAIRTEKRVRGREKMLT